MRQGHVVLYIILNTIFFGVSCFAEGKFPFKNLSSIKSNLGFLSKYSLNPKQQIKVAVLDKGFYGFEKEIGRTLPSNTQYFPGPIASEQDVHWNHGLRMAQILTAMATDDLKKSSLVPQLFLYNVFGYTNFKAAIADLIEKNVDVVLYSEVWEYAGNHDGLGFINVEVNRAIEHGVLWINAAGNFEQTTFNSSIKTLDENWVELPDQNHALKIVCGDNGGDTPNETSFETTTTSSDSDSAKCPVKIVLSWDDFKNDVNLGTKKDLDIALVDDFLNVVTNSSLKQSDDKNENRPGYSKYPREIISTELDRGSYFLRVKNRSLNFTDNDSLRITVDGVNISMPSHSVGESLLNPADNLYVFTVGASDSERSSVSVKLNKPNLLVPSSIILSNGDEVRGSSNAAAIVAAQITLLKMFNPNLKRDQLLDLLKQEFSEVQQGSNESSDNKNSWSSTGLSLTALGFTFTGPGCFLPSTYSESFLPAYVTEVIRQGGVLVATNFSYRIMTPFDPIKLNPGLFRSFQNDMVLATPTGYQVLPRWNFIPQGYVEVFQRPQEAGLCSDRR